MKIMEIMQEYLFETIALSPNDNEFILLSDILNLIIRSTVQRFIIGVAIMEIIFPSYMIAMVKKGWEMSY